MSESHLEPMDRLVAAAYRVVELLESSDGERTILTELSRIARALERLVDLEVFRESK